jgi:hypothetical protein
MGAPVGNQNAAKAKIVADAIRKALANDDWKRLRAGAEKVADAYAVGEPWAVQFVADRMDGKPTQQTEISGPDGGAIETVQKIVREVVESPKASDT